MALINCPECGKKVSDSAVQCPECAYPINTTQNQIHSKKPTQTIEQTGKKWKGMQLIGALLVIVGVVMIVAMSGNPENTKYAGITILMPLIGLCLFIFARIGAWWNHR